MEARSETEATLEAPPGGFLARLSRHAANALRYWEPRRLVYNGVLGLVVAAHFISGLPASRDKLTLDFLLAVFLLAVLANVAYCVVYVGDLFVQFSGLPVAVRWARTVVFLIGTGFAGAITHFFSLGLFDA